VEKVRERRKYCPAATLVEINPAQYPDFSINTIIDCNNVFEKTIDQLVEKLADHRLRSKAVMEQSLILQLRQGVLNSPTVERRIKALLRE